LAHHPFGAEFDRNKPVTLNGSVTKVEWVNPHAYVYMNVKDDQAKMTNWKIELGSPADLEKQGWTRTSLKIGNEITVNGWRAIKQVNLANADSITAAGKTLSAASSANMPDRALADNRTATPVGTSGQALPRTASPMALYGLLGLLSLAAASGLRAYNR
jgi:hypothetical protein